VQAGTGGDDTAGLLIARFRTPLWIGGGLSDNTQKAYTNDLQQFFDWVARSGCEGILEVGSGISRLTLPANIGNRQQPQHAGGIQLKKFYPI